MNSDFGTRFLCFTILTTALFTSAIAHAQEVKRFSSYMEPIEAVNELIVDEDFEGLEDYMSSIGYPNGALIANTFKQWLAGDKVTEVDLLREEALGKTVKRFTYAVRDSADSYMFLRFYAAKANHGWVLYNFNMQSDLSELIPDWKSP